MYTRQFIKVCELQEMSHRLGNLMQVFLEQFFPIPIGEIIIFLKLWRLYFGVLDENVIMSS